MSDGTTNSGPTDGNTPTEERALRGAASPDPLEIVEGLQAQIDDLTRTVERHQAILERLAATTNRPPHGA